MPTLSQEFDFIFADPPYNISNPSNLSNTWNGYLSDKGRWDHVPDYRKFTQQWVFEAYHKLRPGGIIAVIGVYGSLIPVWEAFEGFEELQFQSHFVWHKTNPAPSIHRRMFTHANEIVLIFSKGKRWTFNYEAIKELAGGKQMHNVVNLAAVRKIAGVSTKPEALMTIFLTAFTNPSDLVLDPFLGTGTTAVVCQEMGRSCIGIELDAEIAKVAKERIDGASRT